MKPIINFCKPVSLTPLQAVQLFKQQNSKYKNQKISYAGRLDPMTQGVLLLLIGEENKKITKHIRLNKEYRAQILFNFTTDTYDILGMPKHNSNSLPEKEIIIKAIKSFKGEYLQTLPSYSSYKIQGKPLFHHARNKTLPKELPQKKIHIKKIKINSFYVITKDKLLKQVQSKISKLKGDFRQEQILKQWKSILSKNPEDKFQVAEITFQVSSGTYIRAIANDLGKQLKTGAILLNLIRTKVGKYDIKDSVRLKNI